MLYERYVPPQPLGRFIEYFSYFKDYAPEHAREKILPDGAIELLIDMEESPKKLYAGESDDYVTFRGSWISGERKEYVIVEANCPSLMCVRFYPGGAWPFCSFPLSELTDRVIDLDTVWGTRVHELRERLVSEPSIPQKFAILEAFLLERGRDGLGGDRTTSYLLHRIKSSPHLISIVDLADEVGHTHKHVIDRFNRHVGITPKILARILKFQRVLQSVENRTIVNWASVAQTCGYYDQSHFIKDFKAFSGVNPTTYMEQRGDYINYLNLY